MDSINVIIPSYNTSHTIRDCLDSALAQQCEYSYDITVVDSSSDETPQIIKNEYHNVNLINIKHRISAPAARNIGIRSTGADVLFFIDADCVVRNDWLKTVMTAFEQNSRLHGVGGSYENGPDNGMFGVVSHLLCYFNWLPKSRRTMPAKYLLGGASAYKRNVFEKCMFDEYFESCEDICFSEKAYQKGFCFLFDPSMKVIHNGPEGFVNFIQKQYKYGQGSAMARHQGCTWGKIFIKVPILIFFVPLWLLPKMILVHLFRRDFKHFVIFVLLLPFCVLGNFTWAFGFYKKARSMGKESE